MSRVPWLAGSLEARARFRSWVLEALPNADVLGSSGRDAEERLRLRGRSEKSIVSALCAGTRVEVEDWVWVVGGGCGDCAVETDAGRRLGLASTDGWSVASGDVGVLASSSRTEVVRGVGCGMSDGAP